MKSFFATRLGLQIIAFVVTIASFPYLYIGGIQNNSQLLNIGIILMLGGMLAAPVITFLLSRRTTRRFTKKHYPKKKLQKSH